MPSTNRPYRFEGFVFDPATGELTGPAGNDRLPPKPAALLALLLARPGELVTREELQDALWPDQHVEIDQVLAYTVRQVRAALGDDAAEPRFVETLPRRGYRFVGHRDGDASAAGPARRSAHRRPLVLGIAAAGLLVAVTGFWMVRGRTAGTAPGDSPAPVRIALLPLDDPFEDLGAGPVNDRFTEALLVALTAQPGLDVVGPATTAAYRGTRRPHTELGRELGVSYVVSGGYRPDEAVLFLQLVRVSDGGHLFARRYTGSEAEVARELSVAAAAIAAVASEETPALSNG